MLSLESTSSRMNRLAKHELHLGSFLTMDAMLAAIDGVSHEEVQALVSELLDEDRLALTTLGPLDRRNLPARVRCSRLTLAGPPTAPPASPFVRRSRPALERRLVRRPHGRFCSKVGA